MTFVSPACRTWLVRSFVMAGVMLPAATRAADMPTTRPGASPASDDDRKFVTKAAAGGMTEVELGRLATENGSTDEVKKCGQMMVDDHTKANDSLKSVAAAQGLDIPSEKMEDQKALVTRLSAMSGADFDKAYVAAMVADHREDAVDFTKEARDGSNAAVKSFAQTYGPVIKQHLGHVEGLAKKLGVDVPDDAARTAGDKTTGAAGSNMDMKDK